MSPPKSFRVRAWSRALLSIDRGFAVSLVSLLSILLPTVVARAQETDPTTEAPGRLVVELSAPASVRVGDRIPARLFLEWEGTAASSEGPRFPVWDDGWGPLEVLEAGPVEGFVDQSGRQIWTQSLILTAFETGELRLPPRTVVVPHGDGSTELKTEPTTVTIVSVLPPAGIEGEGEAPELRPPADLAPLARSRRFPIAAVLGVLALLGTAFLLSRRLAAQEPALRYRTPARPPLEELELALGGIDPASSADLVHVGISTGLRRYLGRRAQLNALESTTSELRRGLLSTSIPEGLVHPLIQLFRACDQVKFARREQDSERCADRLATAIRLGKEVEAVLAPRPTETSERAENTA